jgi:gamma-glutamylputrescine oxidase
MSSQGSSYWQKTVVQTPSASELPASADVVVIGGGWLGASTSYWLAKAGIPVVVLDRAPRVAAGATGRNGGFLSVGPAAGMIRAREQFGEETARAVLQVTLDNHALVQQVLAEEEIVCDYREPGHLSLSLSEELVADHAREHQALQAEGVASALLTREEVQDCIQTPLAPAILGALFLPKKGLLHPVKLVEGVMEVAQRYGARRVAATVTAVSPDGEGVCLQTNEGTVKAGSIVIAANAWIDELLPLMKGVITPVRGQVLAYHPIPPLFQTALSVDTALGEYSQQALDGTIILGGCRAIAQGHDIGVRASEPTADVQAALEEVFPQLFPRLTGLQVAQRWAGLMAFTRDHLPVADRAPGLPNAWVVGGFCGHGMPFGMRFGQLLAEAVASKTAPAALAPFRIERASLK